MGQNIDGVRSYAGAQAFLAGGRNKNRRKLANNTYVEFDEHGQLVVRLHQTNIVEFEGPGGQVTVNNGGWRTVTTKNRINGCLPHGWSIGQVDFTWYWYDAKGRRVAEFENFDFINPVDGQVVSNMGIKKSP